MEYFCKKKSVAKFPSRNAVLISIPSVEDSSLAPEGCGSSQMRAWTGGYPCFNGLVPLYFMGKSMVSCRFSLEQIHWLLILTSLDRLFTLEASCGVVTLARCQRNDMEYNSCYRLSRNGVPKADFFHVSRMYNHQIDSISLFTSAQESPPPVNYTSNNHFNELTNPITGEIWRYPICRQAHLLELYSLYSGILFQPVYLFPIERLYIYICVCILMG